MQPKVEPNRRENNSQYGDCEKTDQLKKLMTEAGLDPAWENYYVYASFNPKGEVNLSASHMLPYNPTGRPLDQPLNESLKFDFMWGVLNAPEYDVPFGTGIRSRRFPVVAGILSDR